VGRWQKPVLHSSTAECEDWICARVRLRLSIVGEKKEKVEEALAKSLIRGEEAYIKGKKRNEFMVIQVRLEHISSRMN
jgi:hypothetical protein